MTVFVPVEYATNIKQQFQILEISSISFKNNSCCHYVTVEDLWCSLSSKWIHGKSMKIHENSPYRSIESISESSFAYGFCHDFSTPSQPENPWASQWVLDHPPVASCPRQVRWGWPSHHLIQWQWIYHLVMTNRASHGFSMALIEIEGLPSYEKWWIYLSMANC